MCVWSHKLAYYENRDKSSNPNAFPPRLYKYAHLNWRARLFLFLVGRERERERERESLVSTSGNIFEWNFSQFACCAWCLFLVSICAYTVCITHTHTLWVIEICSQTRLQIGEKGRWHQKREKAGFFSNYPSTPTRTGLREKCEFFFAECYSPFELPSGDNSLHRGRNCVPYCWPRLVVSNDHWSQANYKHKRERSLGPTCNHTNAHSTHPLFVLTKRKDLSPSSPLLLAGIDRSAPRREKKKGKINRQTAISTDHTRTHTYGGRQIHAGPSRMSPPTGCTNAYRQVSRLMTHPTTSKASLPFQKIALHIDSARAPC